MRYWRPLGIMIGAIAVAVDALGRRDWMLLTVAGSLLCFGISCLTDEL